MNKSILLASFIFPERLDWFLNYLETKFNTPKNKVFGYKNLDDESKLIITFKLIVDKNNLNIKELFPSAIIVHKKGEVFYTINALNKLIEFKTNDSIGNIDYKSYQIDWSEYQNKLIILNNKELSFLNINRIF